MISAFLPPGNFLSFLKNEWLEHSKYSTRHWEFWNQYRYAHRWDSV